LTSTAPYLYYMKMGKIISFLESLADTSLQEDYDNAGLLTGDPDWTCTGILCSLDATEEVVQDAITKNCNLIVAHHPIIFRGLKKINGKNYVERTIIGAIKNDIAIYAIHTNLDNRIDGVNGRMAAMLDLRNVEVLAPRTNSLKKLFTFVPVTKAAEVRQALFAAGAGQIGKYSECSFNTEGVGTFRAGEETNPFVGEKGEQHHEPEIRLEMVFPSYLEKKLVRELKNVHPYEEVAYDIIPLSNAHPGTGSGLVGELEVAEDEKSFLNRVKLVFGVPFLRHTPFTGEKIKRVALCGGAGSFLIKSALASGAQAFITADLKYHEFFDAEGRMLMADIGHYESEQFTVALLAEQLEQKFPTFAVLKTAVITNPVHYY
jgi:dinuclear metal center YbgI/SA1388 family protein